MFFDQERLVNRIKNAPNGSELKIFLYIALNQPQDGILGFKSSKSQLAIDLNLKQTTIFKSIRWLKAELFIQELKLDDCSDFMVNPYFVMNNGDFEARKAEWAAVNASMLYAKYVYANKNAAATLKISLSNKILGETHFKESRPLFLLEHNKKSIKIHYEIAFCIMCNEKFVAKTKFFC